MRWSDSLSSSRRERYASPGRRSAAISKPPPPTVRWPRRDPATDPRLRKLDELMWTYLRLLGIEESLERFLETERREDLPQVVQEAEGEANSLSPGD